VFLVDFIHAPCIEENQQDKDVDGTLLRKPEPELETGYRDPVHLFDEQYPEDVGTEEPDGHAGCNESQVCAPVGGPVCLSHSRLCCLCMGVRLLAL
jgi:hypothetical protein